MGAWWWSSSSETSKATENTSNTSSTASGQHSTFPTLNDGPTNGPKAAPTQIAKRELSRDEKAAEELSQFIADFEAEAARERAEAVKDSNQPLGTQGSIVSRLTSSWASSSSPEHSSQAHADTSKTNLISSRDPSDISFQALADEEISCRTAFDYAFFCQSMGGQWTNLYRYGELRQCSHLWKEFWLCMRAKSYSEEEKKKTIKQHNIDKLKKYKTGPSSEDIWDVRERLDVDAPEPFKGDFKKLEQEVMEWKKRTGNEDLNI